MRRLPWVTFSIMAANVIIFYVTLPIIGGQMEELVEHRNKLERFVSTHQELLADETVRERLIEAAMMSKEEAEEIEQQVKASPDTESEYASWLRSGDAQKLREEFDKTISVFTNALKESVWYKYGLSPNGDWKGYQLVTSAFLHAGHRTSGSTSCFSLPWRSAWKTFGVGECFSAFTCWPRSRLVFRA